MTTILFVAPYPPKKDGLATYTQDLVGALGRLVKVHVAAQKPGTDTDEASRVLSINPWSIRRLVRVAERVRPDIVHIQFTVPAYGFQVLWIVLGLLLVRRRHPEVTILWSLHEVYREIELLGSVARMLIRVILRSADGIVVHSDRARSLLIETCGARADLVKHLPHGALGADVPERAVPSSRGPDGPVVFFGFLHPDKGVEYLIEGFAAVPEPAHLVVAGSVRPRQGIFTIFEAKDRRYEAALRHRVRSHGLNDSVTFTGYLSDDQLDDLLNSARVVVFPYLTVTQSGAVNRAIALGCPTVASGLPGLRDDLPPEAILVPPSDSAALAEAITELLASPHRRIALSRAILDLAKLRSPSETARAMLAFYEQVRGARAGR